MDSPSYTLKKWPLFLASSNVKQYQVNILGDYKKCTDYNGTEIKDGEKCNKDEFDMTEVTCEGNLVVDVSCDFYKYGPTTEATYLQIYNLFGFFWGLFFLEALGKFCNADL